MSLTEEKVGNSIDLTGPGKDFLNGTSLAQVLNQQWVGLHGPEKLLNGKGHCHWTIGQPTEPEIISDKELISKTNREFKTKLDIKKTTQLKTWGSRSKQKVLNGWETHKCSTSLVSMAMQIRTALRNEEKFHQDIVQMLELADKACKTIIRNTFIFFSKSGFHSDGFFLSPLLFIPFPFLFSPRPQTIEWHHGQDGSSPLINSLWKAFRFIHTPRHRP